MATLEQVLILGNSVQSIGRFGLKPVDEFAHRAFVRAENSAYRGLRADIASDDLAEIIYLLGVRDDYWPAGDDAELDREFVVQTLRAWDGLPDPWRAKIIADIEVWQITQKIRRRFTPKSKGNSP